MLISSQNAEEKNRETYFLDDPRNMEFGEIFEKCFVKISGGLIEILETLEKWSKF